MVAGAVVLLSQAAFLMKLVRAHLTVLVDRVPTAEAITTRSMWRFAWPYCVFGGLYWCGTASERWALGAFRGLESVGVYQAAYQLGYSPLALCMSAVLAFASPIVFEKVGGRGNSAKLREAHRMITMLTSWTLGCTVFLAAVSILIGPVLYKLLTSAAYFAGLKLVPLALLSAGLFSAAQFMSLDYLNACKSSLLIYPKAISSALAAVFVWLGAKWAGPQGVFIGSIVANIIHLVLIWSLSPTRRGIRAQNESNQTEVALAADQG
jgi:O-antigen/teichoic acid export membrane protein